MILAATVWQHQAEEAFDDILGRCSLGRNTHFLQRFPHFRRQGAVNWL
jgi:hypothetical protein